MTLQDLGNIGEFVGAIAVVLSLLYLAVQIRQNTRSVRSGNSLSFAQLSHSVSSLLVGDERVARIYRMGLEDSAQLNEDQRVQFDALMIAFFRNTQSVFHQRRQSLFDDEEWSAFSRNILWTFRQPGVAQWWESRRVMFSDSFRRFLESEGG